MKHLKNADATWTVKPGYSKKALATPTILNKEGMLVQELCIKAHDSVGPHYHKKQTEIFYFTTVNGTFTVNGADIPLALGDVLIVEPNDVHAVRNDSDQDFRYVAFKFDWEDGDYYESD